MNNFNASHTFKVCLKIVSLAFNVRYIYAKRDLSNKFLLNWWFPSVLRRAHIVFAKRMFNVISYGRSLRSLNVSFAYLERVQAYKHIRSSHVGWLKQFYASIKNYFSQRVSNVLQRLWTFTNDDLTFMNVLATSCNVHERVVKNTRTFGTRPLIRLYETGA